MLLLAVVLGGLLLLFLLLLLTPTLVGVDYLYEGKKQKLKIRFRLLGIPFSFRIPLDKKQEKKKRKEKPEEEKKPLTPKGFVEFVKNLYDGYQEIKKDLFEILPDVRKKVACKEAYLTVRFGTKNPAITGILNGAVWTASSLILKLIDEALGAEKKTLDVQPDFQRVCMCLHIKGTFCFKLIDAIRLVLKIREMVNIVKGHVSRKNTENAS